MTVDSIATLDRPYHAAEIAWVVHEANRAVQVIQAEDAIGVGPHWEDLDEETRQSAVDGVEGVLNGNDFEQSHENWVRFKLDHGWTLGPVKDEVAKTHPLLIPYADLPPSQKLKDELFGVIVKVMAKQGYSHVDGG